MGYEATPANPELEKGSLYSMETDGKLRHHLDKINISNGLAWSSDHQTMYYIDSLPRKLYAFDFDIKSGTLSQYSFLHSLFNIISPFHARQCLFNVNLNNVLITFCSVSAFF